MSLTHRFLQTELAASSRVKERGKGVSKWGTHHIPGSEPNTYVTYLILIITACTAEETEAQGRLAGALKGTPLCVSGMQGSVPS